MKLGDVLKKERENKGLSEEETAAKLAISHEQYQELEAGESSIEVWGPRLAELAIALETPTSRLIAESGRSQDAEKGQVGRLVGDHRKRSGKSVEELAEAAGMKTAELEAIEGGDTELEVVAPRLLAFAETIEQPVFNLFYPCGLPFQELDDYP